MPYYIYKIDGGVSALVRRLEMIEKHDNYREAKLRVKAIRNEAAGQINYRVVFAANPLQAEEMLSEQRDRPILAEWEK